MATAAERMRNMRDRRRTQGLREVRLLVPDLRLASVRRRLARQAAKLNPADESAVLDWIEAVAEFDAPAGQS